MHPYFTIFGRLVPAFGLMVVLGVTLAVLLVVIRSRRTNISREDALFACLIAICGAMIGAVALKTLMKLPDILLHWERYAEIPVGTFFTYLFGELVFYGGLLGGAVGALIYCSSYRVSILSLAELVAPAIPLGHAIGRIGCYMGGCCYGVHVDAQHPLAIVYPELYPHIVGAAPSGIPLLAVPLIEATFNLLLMCVILLYQRKTLHNGRSLLLYGLLYSVERFVLEYYRGDLVRGVYGALSTSQYISIALFLLCIVLWILSRRSVTPKTA